MAASQERHPNRTYQSRSILPLSTSAFIDL